MLCFTSSTLRLQTNNLIGTGSFSFILMFLLFISSAFVPIETMPKAVQIFADYQPMTPIIESVRSLLMGESPGSNTLIAIIWFVGIFLLFRITAMQVYKRRMRGMK
ncbi:ABC transporter permease [Bacillus rhizoplanae]|uniref:ABC transporter permease n=1 Tax=Bacillus rhizoplanae TaxID=2880966 RepID=UPI003D23DC95